MESKAPNSSSWAHLREISPGLAALVVDWRGFEQRVAKMHEVGQVTVTAPANGTKGKIIDWDIDVLITVSGEDGGTRRTIVECKYWNKPVGVEVVTHLSCVMEDVGADSAVIFSTIGFQSGATKYAEATGIELYRVRDLLPEEWGTDGQHIWMNLVQHRSAIGNLKLHGPNPLPPAPDPSATKIFHSDGRYMGTWADRIELLRVFRYDEIQANDLILPGDGTYYVHLPTPVLFAPSGWIAEIDDVRFPVTGFEVEIIFELRQEWTRYDRSRAFDHALTVEEMINRRRHISLRRKEANQSFNRPIGEAPAPVPIPEGQQFQDGSWVHYFLTRPEDFSALKARYERQESEGVLMKTGREYFDDDGNLRTKLPAYYYKLKWFRRSSDPDPAVWATSDVLDPADLG